MKNENGNNGIKEDIIASLTPETGEDDIEVTEEDFELKEEQDKREAELLKEKFGIPTEPEEQEDSEKLKKRKKKALKSEEPQDPVLTDAEESRQIYELTSLNKTIRLVSSIVGGLVLVMLTFFIAGYLQYTFVAEGGLSAEAKNHEHDYSNLGRRVEGDCAHYGYTTYICNYPYCGAETKVFDLEYGNHKYKLEEDIFEDAESGRKYKKYVCNVCGVENKVYE